MAARAPEELHALVERAFNARDIEAFMDLYDEDATLIVPPDGERATGKEAIREAVEATLALQPEARMEVVDKVEVEGLALTQGYWTLVGAGEGGVRVEMTGRGTIVAYVPFTEHVGAHPKASSLAAAVGARVRELRQARDVSLNSLARATGLGKGTLSELEAGSRNPTLATLFAITTALEVPISAPLPAAQPGQEAPEPIRGDAIEAWLVDRFVDTAATSELYRVRIGAGRDQYSEAHAAGVTEHWIVYAGVVELGPCNATVRLGPGESASFVADVAHRYEVIGDNDVAATLLVRYPR